MLVLLARFNEYSICVVVFCVLLGALLLLLLVMLLLVKYGQ